MRPYVMRLTNGFIQKARGYFDQMLAEMEGGEYTGKVIPKLERFDPKLLGYQPPKRPQS